MKTLRKRLRMAAKRRVKVNKLKGPASRKGKVFLSGILPSVGYGSAINAPTPALLRRWRSEAAADMRLRGRAGSLALAWALAPD